MTYEESYRYWKNRYELSKDFRDPHWECGEAREHREWCEHMKNAFEALEKQIPKKKHKYSGFRCMCGEMVAKNQDYCEYCGQRLEEWNA